MPKTARGERAAHAYVFDDATIALIDKILHEPPTPQNPRPPKKHSQPTVTVADPPAQSVGPTNGHVPLEQLLELASGHLNGHSNGHSNGRPAIEPETSEPASLKHKYGRWHDPGPCSIRDSPFTLEYVCLSCARPSEPGRRICSWESCGGSILTVVEATTTATP